MQKEWELFTCVQMCRPACVYAHVHTSLRMYICILQAPPVLSNERRAGCPGTFGFHLSSPQWLPMHSLYGTWVNTSALRPSKLHQRPWSGRSVGPKLEDEVQTS